MGHDLGSLPLPSRAPLDIPVLKCPCRFISRSSKLPQISDMFTQQLQVSAASQDAASTADRSTVHIPAPSSNGSAASSTSSIAEGTESGAAAAAAASASEGFRVVDVPYYQLDLLWCHAPLGGRLVTAADHSRWKQQDYEGVQKLQPDMQPPYLVRGLVGFYACTCQNQACWTQ